MRVVHCQKPEVIIFTTLQQVKALHRLLDAYIATDNSCPDLPSLKSLHKRIGKMLAKE